MVTDHSSDMQDSTRTDSAHDPEHPDQYGVLTHKERGAACPACAGMGIADIGVRDVSCPYCSGEGRVSHTRADIIERQVQAQGTEPIG